MTQDTINFLNGAARLKLAPSKIHGIGVFAFRPINKGAKLNANLAPFPYAISPGNQSKLFPEVRENLLERWPKAALGEPFAFPDCVFQGYMNHSDDPNYDSLKDVALRDIAVGEEITENYRNIPNWEIVFPWVGDKK